MNQYVKMALVTLAVMFVANKVPFVKNIVG